MIVKGITQRIIQRDGCMWEKLQGKLLGFPDLNFVESF
ncbi:hypothetical protein Q648_00946 [Bartonella quintana JK 12]|uniref:Uncharacterized protein n=2 Tax=Bartonella quintana TaxID=803 RepID=W3U2P5_BARQI|nr:hypothetical protein Q651_00821 [Bartonella quintana BQ2-D70]ETS14701.1 hypothetical protein Q650_00088 [Bartonella quintana JK 73rel]ETS17134.1 hypothetical protein Q649_00089 [Bartonella quintana JK 73]ETS17229.1 hypothetical protein Q648_00946 [Bartonella quintana JK 12]ETS19427.1 hypothetical protein Q647_00088 [Bartonella quintana JK 7]KEC58276.1 hypothetical protein O93_01149 [Bartonella quintana JK 19]KEC62182.1 hypothetical protein O91_00800 [Bartonella quintana JK 31]KEC63861.1 h